MTSLFNKNELDKIKDIYKNLESDDEFEIMFGGYNKHNNINMKKFLDIMKYLKKYSNDNKLKLEYSNTLDIAYNYDKNTNDTYRLSLIGLDKINNLMSSLNGRKNHIIFSILCSKILNDDNENLEIINKIKDQKNIFNVDEHDLRIRCSKEKKVSKKELDELVNLDKVDKLSIFFRYKNRLSLILESNNEVELRIDATSIKQGNNINTIQTYPFNYELELEFIKKKKITAKKEKEYLDKVLSITEMLKKVIEQSNYLINNSEKQEVLSKYKELIFGKDGSSQKTLYGMALQSLEVVHMVDYLPNRYSITDKPDGDRVLGLIHNNRLYVIFMNLEVSYTGIEIDKKNSNYNNTIVDGEYIFLPKYNKYLLATFDILYYCNENVRSDPILQNRYNKLDDVLRKCFNFKNETKEFKGNFDLDKISNFYENEMIEYIDSLNKSLDSIKGNVVTKKYFAFVKGGSDSEVFKYSSMMWNLYTKDSRVKLPYILDGIIFTPQEQKYTTILKDTKYRTYKWKPPNQNTIDFFVRFEKNPETGKIINVYDDSNESKLSGKVYKILNLYNGKNVNNIEVPTLFKKEDNLHIARLPVANDGDVIRDEEGDMIQDNTVVEFSYKDDLEIPFHFRWIPLRTRHDKTESVIKHKKKYGNNMEIANKIWNSIQQNVTIEDLLLLADIKEYDNQINELKKRIDATTVAIEKQQDAYYQKTTNLAQPMRNFHNYIKSNLIFSYCSPKEVNGRQQKLSILDIGCGRGGDIQKFFHSRIKNYVGFDPDSNGIHSSTDGAISRYINFKKKMPNMPKMDFFIADGGSLLDYQSQQSSIGKMPTLNSNFIKKYFGETKEDTRHEKFDVLNCQLAVHFFLKSELTWNNFCDNINKYIEEDGYLLLTTFDGEMLHKGFLENDGKIQSFYTEDGENKKFFEFTRNYDPKTKEINNLGLTYNAFVTLIKDDDTKYDVEALVSKDYVINQLKDKCKLDIVETGLFYDHYKQNEYFFKNIVPNEERKETKSYLMKVLEYYNQEDSINKACLEFTKYHRFFIFKKRHTNTINVTREKKPKKEISVKVSKNIKKDKKNSLIDRYLEKRTNVIDI